jgi:hypothetical protein
VKVQVLFLCGEAEIPFSIESAGARAGPGAVTKEWQRHFEEAQRRPA